MLEQIDDALRPGREMRQAGQPALGLQRPAQSRDASAATPSPVLDSAEKMPSRQQQLFVR